MGVWSTRAPPSYAHHSLAMSAENASGSRHAYATRHVDNPQDVCSPAKLPRAMGLRRSRDACRPPQEPTPSARPVGPPRRDAALPVSDGAADTRSTSGGPAPTVTTMILYHVVAKTFAF